jgi:hypothetical protein
MKTSKEGCIHRVSRDLGGRGIVVLCLIVVASIGLASCGGHLTRPPSPIEAVVGKRFSGTVRGTLNGAPYSSAVWIEFSTYFPGGLCSHCHPELRGKWYADSVHSGTATADPRPLSERQVKLYLDLSPPCDSYWVGDVVFDPEYERLTGSLRSLTECESAEVSLDVTSVGAP